MKPTLEICPRLIDDLIPLILDSDDHWWSCDFLRLALVSPSWLHSVRRRLYARPSLDSYRACTLLARTLTENPLLTPLICGIDLHPSTELTCDGVMGRDMESLRFLLGLHGLQSVTLGGDLAVKAERFLDWVIDSYAITELHVDGKQRCFGNGCPRYRQPASLLWDGVLGSKFANLTKLQLSDIELDIIPPSILPPLRLTELFIYKAEIYSGHLHHLSNDWTSLRRLSIIARSTSDFDEHIRTLLPNCGPNLETLHYDVRDVRLDEAVFHNGLVPCPALRELRLNGLDVNPSMLSSIGQRCENLKELSVQGRVVRVTPNEWAAFIRSGALPSLQQLITPHGHHNPPFTYWSEAMGKQVLEACALRGIKLSIAFLRSL